VTPELDAAVLEASNLVTVQFLGIFAVAIPVLKTIWESVKSLTAYVRSRVK
jgi:hypothetical protein